MPFFDMLVFNIPIFDISILSFTFAFLGFFWLLGLAFYFTFIPVHLDREPIVQQYRACQERTGILSKIAQALFLLFNAYALCPTKGAAVSVAFIGVFFLIF